MKKSFLCLLLLIIVSLSAYPQLDYSIQNEDNTISQKGKVVTLNVVSDKSYYKRLKLKLPPGIKLLNGKRRGRIKTEGNSYHLLVPDSYTQSTIKVGVKQVHYTGFGRTFTMIWRIGLKYPVALSLTAVCVGVDVITIYQGLFSDDWFYFTELGIKLWPTYRKYKEEVQMNDILLINNNWGISLPGDDSQPDTYTPTEQVSENVPQQVPASSDQQVVDNNQPTVNQEPPPDNSSTPISGEDQGLSTVKNNSSGGSDLSLFSPEELVLKSNDLKVTIRQREVALQDPVFCSGSDASSNGKKMHLMELSVEIKNTSGQQGYLKGHLRVDRGNNGCACDCSEAKINIPKNNCQDNTESHCSTNWDTGRGCGIDFVFGKNTDDNTSTVNSTNSGMIVEHLCSDRNDSYVVKKSCWYFEKPEIDPGVTNTIKLSLIKD